MYALATHLSHTRMFLFAVFYFNVLVCNRPLDSSNKPEERFVLMILYCPGEIISKGYSQLCSPIIISLKQFHYMIT